MPLNIVLVEPEIPQNTGNVARTCAATGTALHLVEPLGFSLKDRYLKRAGLDYWHLLDLHVHKNLNSFLRAFMNEELFFVSTKARIAYTDMSYGESCFLVFGKETRGLPESLLAEHLDRCVRIPMKQDARSLNLSNAVAIIAYEALRQQGFTNLIKQGQLKAKETV
jgi:tRNA (cytidine/uridine-2'-O-)-methyltransferase